MSKNKEAWIDTSGFRICDNPSDVLKRKRIAELAKTIKDGSITPEQRTEYVTLVESLPDDDDL